MSRHWSWMATLFTVALVQTSAAQSPADADAKDTARQLAETGRKRFDAGDYAGALQALTDAEKYFHAPTITRMRALTEEKLGHLLEARALHKQVVDEKLPAGAPPGFVKAQEDAKAALESLEKRIPRVQITLTRAPPETRIALDGKNIETSTLATPFQLNPGKHTITVEPPGAERIIRHLDLKEQSVETVSIDLAPLVPPKPAIGAGSVGVSPAYPSTTSGAATSSSTMPARAPLESGGSFLGPAIALGVGTAGLIVGAISGGVTVAKVEQLKEICPKYPVCPEASASHANVDDAKTMSYVSTAAFVVAGIGATTGVVLLLLRLGKKEKGGEPSRATLTFGPAFVGVKGRF